nr:ATP-dependent DNA helicase [Roseateles oligotrophus]
MCEFSAKRGDLDLRFTPAPSALEGIEGHALVVGRRAAGYQSEVSLSGEFEDLRVRGRADGYDPERLRLEEIKTFKGRLEAMPANHRALHWAQLKVYGALQCQALGLESIELALVYFDVKHQTETVFTERAAADDLQAFFQQQCEFFLGWARLESAHREARDEALLGLRFPHGEFRAGQRALAEAVYKGAVAGRCLLAQAPTGIGKTIATLFPLLKAAPAQGLDKIVFLTAKTSGRGLALDSLASLQTPARLRVLELIAKDKACEHPDKACHGESCPLAQGFYDRLPAARLAAIRLSTLDRQALRDCAREHAVCPYYLSQELARWADVIVGDYNYYFDQTALLHGMAQAYGWKLAVLVDEAHNLVERARKMYSAELDQQALAWLGKSAPAALKKPLERVKKAWAQLAKAQSQPYQVHAEIPAQLLTALQQAVSSITEYWVEHPADNDEALQGFYFEALHFTRMAESFGPHALCDTTLEAPEPGAFARNKKNLRLHLRNVVPAAFLKERFETAHAITLFSATLQPSQFYRDLLGLPDNAAWVDVASPFRAEQLQVRIAGHLSTRYRDREASLQALVQLMAAQYRARPGNYLAFFSSYSYLEQALQALQRQHPELPTWTQSRRMSEGAQQQFLDRFSATSQGIAFAVLGGSFSEGVDLPGARLIGAFIATLGLPQVNEVNEQFRQRLDDLLGQGYDYTYVFPGLQKVVQAAGRVIRTVDDEGVIHLMDDRYLSPQVQQLLPSWWGLKHHGT